MEQSILQAPRSSLNTVWSLEKLENKELIPHLFRTEYGKIVAVLCKAFGLSNIQLAEDITSEAFLKATETWGLKGVPDNPSAWLYTVAKNKVKDYFKRENVFSEKITPDLKRTSTIYDEIDIDLTDKNIEDSQLQMLFAVCDPKISSEGQITFALRVLCGFGITEIASALLTSKATINKRLLRTKEAFRRHKIAISIPPSQELEHRLNNVLSVLYLLFNEGYYSTSSEKTLKKELCVESMRLLYLLLNFELTNKPQANALMALLCFHASRFESRIKTDGPPILYDQQDRSVWDVELIKKGEFYLAESTANKQLTKYHLEAMIAFWHTRIDMSQDEKWQNILQLYNQLIQIEYSPITALNRTYALAIADGKKTALKEALKINLSGNHLYHVLLAELYQGDDQEQEIKHLEIALDLANTTNDKSIIDKKLRNARQRVA